MSDYISRKAAVKIAKKYGLVNGSALGRHTGLADCIAIEIEGLPAADVEPVRHGRWECVYDYYTGETDITCSHCKNTRTVNGCFVSTDGKSCYFEDDYCPNCGAKMQGAENE